MRRQYHARRVKGKTFIWDVHRLVRLTKDAPVKEVLVSSIRELYETFWFSDAAPSCRAVAHHSTLINEADLQYPIILSARG